MNGRLQLLDAADRDAVGLRESRQRVELFLIIERLVGGILECVAGGFGIARLARILLTQADFVEHRRDETAPDFGRCAEAFNLRRQ